ncbi:hypothetical protein SAMN05518865_1121 [Duganella sp. CF458]|nr:hypothetical protein SAMN05518865_1121 [Duganella sp. CF458]
MQSMDIEFTLFRIRTQIKFDRVTGVRNTLVALLDQYTGSEHEAEILEILALGFLKSIKDYKSAIPLLKRLLFLEISANLRQQTTDFLLECQNKEKIAPSEPDSNNPSFIEFIEFIRSKKIFSSPSSPGKRDTYFAINDLEMAEKLAWHQGIDQPFLSWNGLRSQAAKQVYTYYFENKISMDLIDDIISSEIMKICESSVPTELMNFYDDIYGDLVEIARGRLVEVVTDLHKSMWEAYTSNIFPCGWRGSYPEGKLCIYTP